MNVWFSLTQIATLHGIGFRAFEIFNGMTGPVGILHGRLGPQSYRY